MKFAYLSCKLGSSVYLTNDGSLFGFILRQAIAPEPKGVLLTMARKSKRETLNEAIRQGQAKIAEGLKSGRMTSGNAQSSLGSGSQTGPDTRDFMSRPAAYGRGDLLKSKKDVLFEVFERLPKAQIAAISAGVVIIVLLIIWISGGDQAKTGVDSAGGPAEGQNAEQLVEANGQDSSQEPIVPFDFLNKASKDTEKVIAAKEQTEPDRDQQDYTTSKGDNVIWIQSIDYARQNELLVVRDFFASKGIPTEIIQIGNLAVLVTKQGFENNPGSRSTEGYELLQRIKQLGSVYVQETEDTKFGVRPFQDAYGYKR